MYTSGPWGDASVARHCTVASLQRTRSRFVPRVCRILTPPPLPWPKRVAKSYPTAAADVVRKIGAAVGFVCERCGLGASMIAHVCSCPRAHFKCNDCSFRPCGNGGLWQRIGVPEVPPRRVEVLVDATTQPLLTTWTLTTNGSTPHLNLLPVVRNTERLRERAVRLGCPETQYERLLRTAEVPDSRDYLALLHIGARDHPRELFVTNADRQAAAVFAFVWKRRAGMIPPTETLGMTLMDAETGAVGVTVIKVAAISSAAAVGISPGTVITAVNGESIFGLSSVDASAVLFKAAAASKGSIVLWVHPCTQHHRAARIEPRVLPTAASLREASALSLLSRGREVAADGLCVVLVACPELVGPLHRKLASDPTLFEFEKFGCTQLTVTLFSGVDSGADEQVRLVELDSSLDAEPISLTLKNAACIVVTYLPAGMAQVVRDALTNFMHSSNS